MERDHMFDIIKDLGKTNALTRQICVNEQILTSNFTDDEYFDFEIQIRKVNNALESLKTQMLKKGKMQ